MLVACGSDEADSDAGDSVTIEDPWSREPVEGQTTSAVYGIMTNDGGETVRAVAASTPVTDNVELHEVVENDEGQMSMRERDGGYEISAGESITLEPGGFHIMLLDIDPAEYPDEVDVTVEFEDGSTLDFTAEVREVEGMDMDHYNGDVDHGDDDHDHGDDDHDHGDEDHSDHDDEMDMESDG